MTGLDELTPEQLRSILELGSLDEQSADLTDRLQRALAMQQPTPNHHATAAGALIAGLGDMLNAGMGASEEQALRAEQKRVAQQRLAGRLKFSDALFSKSPSAPPLVPFSYASGPEQPPAPSTPFGYAPLKPGPWR